MEWAGSAHRSKMSPIHHLSCCWLLCFFSRPFQLAVFSRSPLTANRFKMPKAHRTPPSPRRCRLMSLHFMHVLNTAKINIILGFFLPKLNQLDKRGQLLPDHILLTFCRKIEVWWVSAFLGKLIFVCSVLKLSAKCCQCDGIRTFFLSFLDSYTTDLRCCRKPMTDRNELDASKSKRIGLRAQNSS